MPPSSPHLSLVIPAFNEEARLAASMHRVAAFLESLPYSTEIVLVDDGSAAAGGQAVVEAAGALPQAIGRQVIHHEVNRGKGAAVRTGSLAASGDYIAFIDADLATPPEDLLVLIEALDFGADVAIGVRNQGDGNDMRNHRGLARRLAGKLFSTVMQVWLLPDIEDSQCPLKVFRRDAAHRLFQLQEIDTWAFDAEILYLASRLGLKVAKRPVRWQAVAGSHLKLDLKKLEEVWNLLRIRWLHRSVTPRTLAETLVKPVEGA